MTLAFFLELFSSLYYFILLTATMALIVAAFLDYNRAEKNVNQLCISAKIKPVESVDDDNDAVDAETASKVSANNYF